MGKYINQTSKGPCGALAEHKCNAILSDGAIEIPEPSEFLENLVCVVDNGYFGAAAHIYNDNEFDAFTYRGDHRPKRWFVWDKVKEFAE